MMTGITTHITPVSLGDIIHKAPIQPTVCKMNKKYLYVLEHLSEFYHYMHHCD